MIGSADWMYRNLNARVEAVCPVEDRGLRARLWQILNICLSDEQQRWDLLPNGHYELRRPTGAAVSESATQGTHATLMNLAQIRAASETAAAETE
jgi:polyphosphate kinase